MLERVKCNFRHAALAILLGVCADASAEFLGPLNPGAEQADENWYYGTNGTGIIAIDHSTPASGGGDFLIGNTSPGKENRADWRSQAFSLGGGTDGRELITFSFSSKLTGNTNSKECIIILVRYFDATGNYMGQKKVRVRPLAGAPEQVSYKRTVVHKLHAPEGAKTADVWVTANVFEPWTAGFAQFDDFSVTVPGMNPWPGIAAGGLVIAVTTIFLVQRRRAATLP